MTGYSTQMGGEGSKPLDRAALDRVARRLEDRLGVELKARDEFIWQVAGAVSIYLGDKHRPAIALKSADRATLYARLHREAGRTRATLAKLLENNATQFDLRGAVADLSPDQIERVQLIAARNPLDGLAPALGTLAPLTEALATVMDIERWAGYARDAARARPEPRGRPFESNLHGLIVDLASVYERHTGRRAGTSLGGHERRTGPFVAFVKDVLSGLEMSGRLALGETIAKVLRERKSLDRLYGDGRVSSMIIRSNFHNGGRRQRRRQEPQG